MLPVIQDFRYRGRSLSLFQCLRLQLEDCEVQSWNHLKSHSPTCFWMVHVAWYLSWICWLKHLYEASMWYHLTIWRLGPSVDVPQQRGKTRQKLSHLLWPGFLLIYFWTFYFVLGSSWLTMLWYFHMNSEGTQPYIYMYPFSPSPYHPGCHITLWRVPCAVQ